MTITTNKKDLTHTCSKEFDDLFHPYPKSWNWLWHYSSTDQDQRAARICLHYLDEKYQQNSSDGSFASKLISRKRALEDGSRQKNATIYKVNNVSSRQYPTSYQQYPTPYQQYPTSYKQCPTPSRQYPTSYQQCPTPYQEYPTAPQQYPTPSRQYPISYQQHLCTPHQNTISTKFCPISYQQNAWTSIFCPIEVHLFNSGIQFSKVSEWQFADYPLTGSGSYEMYYQCTLKTIEEAEATSSRGPVHTINLIFN